MTSDVAIARWRLRNQHLVAPHAGSTADVVSGLLAVQAENPSQSAWAVAARTDSPDAAGLTGLIASGDVVRTHVLRPTWHFVAAEDLRPAAGRVVADDDAETGLADPFDFDVVERLGALARHLFLGRAFGVLLVLRRLPDRFERKRVIKHNEERIFTHIHRVRRPAAA